jgi:hypothetical protein
VGQHTAFKPAQSFAKSGESLFGCLFSGVSEGGCPIEVGELECCRVRFDHQVGRAGLVTVRQARAEESQ